MLRKGVQGDPGGAVVVAVVPTEPCIWQQGLSGQQQWSILLLPSCLLGNPMAQLGHQPRLHHTIAQAQG